MLTKKVWVVVEVDCLECHKAATVHGVFDSKDAAWAWAQQFREAVNGKHASVGVYASEMPC